MLALKLLVSGCAAALVSCAVEPVRYGEVVTMGAGQAPEAAYPAPGTVWRLDENELKRLSPAPLVPAPPPPQLPPPPRPNESYSSPPPYYGPSYWGPGYHHWRGW